MSISAPGVVERASKEISRRIHSLGFKTSKKKSLDEAAGSESSTEASSSASSSSSCSSDPNRGKKVSLSESDRLNGNNQPAADDGGAGGSSSAIPVAASGSSCKNTSLFMPPSSPSTSYRNMGSIIKGSVMDKVTNVFSAANNMGNSQTHTKEPAVASSEADNVSTSCPSTITIPKGAVANGRAKFEAQTKQVGNEAIKSNRFFSRSRSNSPMLPVRTPKVPSIQNAQGQPSCSAESASGNNVSSQSSPPMKSPADKSKDNQDEDSQASKALPPSITPTNKFASKLKRFETWQELWKNVDFLTGFFGYFNSFERCVLAQVCQVWRDVLYDKPEFWKEVHPVLHCRTIRTWSCTSSMESPSSSSASEGSLTGGASSSQEALKHRFFDSLKRRAFDTICLLHANDNDIFDFIQSFPHGAKHVQSLILRGSNVSDRALEAIMEFLQALYKLEISGCNEITEQGLWSSLHPRLISLTITDCINVADECICAATQLLPALYEFNLQAYHVTDSALSYFSPKQTATLNVLRLQSCWEITNHGIVNIVHTLPNLTVLSLSGCSKITDDGIELIAENLRKLRSLDVSWCPRITDAALEYIACDLNHLEQLTLDRCVHVTDIGIGYISTMLALHTLYLRWCSQIRDFGLQHICGMRSMQTLSIAGCSLLTSSGLSNLIQLRHLKELEMTNCPGASPELIEYLRQNLPRCLVLD